MTEMLKTLPLGVENFTEIINNNLYYVDKTPLIRDILQDGAKITLFTRPRRFGKTLMMSMLRSFFEVGTDPALFDGLAIADEKVLCEQYLGKYPVISVSLKDVAGKDFSQAVNALNRVLQTEIRRHQYLIESHVLSEIDITQYKQLLSTGFDAQNERTVSLLSELLSKHFDQKVIILIDEYDVPLAKAYDYGYYNEMVILIRNVLHQALKTNDHLQMAVLTGCMRVAKESIFTGLNNLKVQSIIDTRYDEYFGFTDAEVKEMLTYYGFAEKYQTARLWYDGYTFGRQSVYCPWDVINYIFDLRADPNIRAQNYWINSSSNDIIRRFLDKADDTTRWELEQLIEGKTIEKEIYAELTYGELDKTIDHLWSVLFTTGYLTYEPSSSNERYNDDTFGSGLHLNTLLLKIPNEEIRYIFKNQIYVWFNDHVETDAERYKSFSQAFIDGDAQKIEEMFTAYLSESISIRDTSIKKAMKENFYHGILLGILRFRRDWIVRSNQESEDGYNDIMIMYNPKKIGIVIEVKYADNKDLDAECSKALDQIERLHYTQALEEHEPVMIYKYAIACYKKRCKVVIHTENFES